MSRTFDALRRAEVAQWRRLATDRGRSFQVVTVTSNKGGVGKTTVASNLAVYLRERAPDVPILVLGLDDQPMLDRMFGIEGEDIKETIVDGIRAGSLASAIRLGQYGVHYVPSSPRVADLKKEIEETDVLENVLVRTGWEGLVIVDTKSDLEILTRNAIAAADLSIVVVKDHDSLLEAHKIYELLGSWKKPAERARILLSLVDLRVKFAEDTERDILTLLLGEIRRRQYPLFETFLSRSPKVESLHTNPSGRAVSILHGARGTLAHRQMQRLAADVLQRIGRTDEGLLPGAHEVPAASGS